MSKHAHIVEDAVENGRCDDEECHCRSERERRYPTEREIGKEPPRSERYRRTERERDAMARECPRYVNDEESEQYERPIAWHERRLDGLVRQICHDDESERSEEQERHTEMKSMSDDA